MDMSELTSLLGEHGELLRSYCEKQAGDRDALTNLVNRVLGIEQMLAAGGSRLGAGGPAEPDTVGGRFVKALDRTPFDQHGRVRVVVKNIIDTSVVGTTTTLPPVGLPPGLPTRLRDFLAQRGIGTTNVEFARETVFTNAAAVVAEKAQKPESAKTFELVTVPTVTIAHWIQASRQAWEDNRSLQTLVNTQMIRGLLLEEEDYILNAATVGLMANAFDAGAAGAGVTKPDTIAAAIAKIVSAGLRPNAVVLNAADWLAVATLKDSTGQYLFGTGQSAVAANMWGVPVVQSFAMAAGSYLVMDGRSGAELCIRDDATVEASREDRDNWIKNLLTILAEMREALCVFLPQSAFVKGTFATS